ncbi:MAG: M61 family metallopeptidase [Proteobacteria bacterium]|nr:M61 family metallopeptidase [Pseudomonadota bacterium]
MLLFSLLALAAADPSAVQAHLDFSDAAHHVVHVRLTFPEGAEGGRELYMPSWTPGSYKIRDFARHVEGVAASADGEPVPTSKVAKNRWHVEYAGPFTLSYDVYARELGVQTSFVDDRMAVLNGASLFLFEHGAPSSFELELQTPEGWAVHTALERQTSGDVHRFLASTVDELIDSPILVGQADVQVIAHDGIDHELVSMAFAPSWDAERAAADLAKLIQVQTAFWGQAPYANYSFLCVGGGGGGLEHLDSTLMMSSAHAMADEESYEGWLGLASHEFFHTWNVKRLRPVELGPFDYETEVYTDSLWVAEGLTSYFGPLLLRRADLLDEASYLEGLSRSIDRLQRRPGRHVRSLEASSFDAWVKHYQRDENTKNTSVSYYGKGSVVGFLLDAELRRRGASLDRAMVLAYERYSGETGFTPDQFRDVLSEVADEDMRPWLDTALAGTEELDYAPALALYGLQFADPEDEEPSAWLGVEHSAQTLSVVVRGGPAWDAGLAVGDEVLAIDGYRSRDMAGALAKHKAGDTVTVLISRRGRLEEREVTLGSAVPQFALEWVEKPTRAQKRARAAWLGGE